MKGTRFLICMTWLLLCGASVMAQNYMRVHHKGGGYSDVAVSQIDSVTFVTKEAPEEEVSLTAGWLWGSLEQGYYELLTFNEDHTYVGYDNYFTYGFDTTTYGWWGQMGAMLTLQSNGVGYQRRYNWFVTELTENALAVMTQMGPFTYYKLQPETLTIRVNGLPITCEEGDSFVFADGVTAAIQDGRLVGLRAGTTYVQKHSATSGSILSYKVVVE